MIKWNVSALSRHIVLITDVVTGKTEKKTILMEVQRYPKDLLTKGNEVPKRLYDDYPRMPLVTGRSFSIVRDPVTKEWVKKYG